MTRESATNSPGISWLRVLRLALGVSIYDLSKQARFSPARISLIERRGLAEAEPLEVRKLASALNLPTRDITEAFMLKVDPHVLVQLAGQRFLVPCNEGANRRQGQ